jgi:type III restriction enzyme
LAWQTEEKIAKKKSVDKRGAKSDEAYVKEVLGDMANATNIIVINDEAHHAWRVPAESKIKGVKKEDIEESTVWVGGLRPHKQSKRNFALFRFIGNTICTKRKKSK